MQITMILLFIPLVVSFFELSLAGPCWNLSELTCGYSAKAVLSGPRYQLGDFHECIENFQQQYCLVEIQFSAGKKTSTIWNNIQEAKKNKAKFRRDVLSCGFCVPNKANLSSVISGLEEDLLLAAEEIGVIINVTVNADNCQKKSEINLDTADITFLCVITVILSLVIIGSVMEKTITEKKKDRKGMRLLLAFSIKKNFCKLLETSHSELTFIHGLRVILTFLVVMDHVLYFSILGPLANPTIIEQSYENVLLTPFIGGNVVICAFFVISSFLMSHTILHKFEANGKYFQISNYFCIVLQRYLRLAPSLIIMVTFTATIMRHIGNGPMWPQIVLTETNACQKDWWIVSLFLNNIAFDRQEICLRHTWYLSADTQLFTICLLLLMFCWYLPKISKYIFTISMIFASVIPFVITLLYKLDPIPIHVPETVINLVKDPTVLMSYIPSYMNIAPYVVGTFSGYMLFKFQRAKIMLSKTIIIVGWIVIPVLMIGILYSSNPFYQSWYQENHLISAIYSAVHKSVFSVAFSAVLFFCSAGYGSFFEVFLGWKPFIPLSRLSYNIYLVHFILLEAMSGSIDSSYHFKHFEILSGGLVVFLKSVILALLLSLCVESPARNLQIYFIQGLETSNCLKNSDPEYMKRSVNNDNVVSHL